jgi:hypothetical protein
VGTGKVKRELGMEAAAHHLVHQEFVDSQVEGKVRTNSVSWIRSDPKIEQPFRHFDIRVWYFLP